MASHGRHLVELGIEALLGRGAVGGSGGYVETVVVWDSEDVIGSVRATKTERVCKILNHTLEIVSSIMRNTLVAMSVILVISANQLLLL